MSSRLRIILISNLVTIIVTAIAVVTALHMNPSLVGDDPTVARTLQEEGRMLQNEGDCCDCDTGDVIPAPAPDFGGICFSALTVTELENGDNVPMKDLSIGDRVLVSNGKYEPIYSFGHFDTSVNKAEFLQIRTSTSLGLEMSPNHMIFKEGNEVVAVSNLVVGDKVMMGSGVTDEVVSIDKVTRTGVFAPFTPSGTIVTNGVQSSCFATVQEGKSKVSLGAGMDLPLTYHQLGLVFESPHRLICHFSSCSDKYNKEGMSQWVEAPLEGLEWILQQNPFVGGLVFLITFIFLVAINLLELILVKSPASFVMSTMCMMMAIPSFRHMTLKLLDVGGNKSTKVA